MLITLDVASDFHIQINDFLGLTLPEDAPISIGPWTTTQLTVWSDHEVLKGRTALRAPFTLKDGLSPGSIETALTLGFQGCAEQPIYACFPPDEAELPLQIEVLPVDGTPRLANQDLFDAHGGLLAGSAEAGAGAVPEGEPGGKGLAQRLEAALASGSIVAFLLVFLGGILTSFTPCVYPMIPITISFVGGRARNRAHGFILSLFFVLGIAIMA